MKVDETKFVKKYMELTDCSEAAARNVYILFPHANRDIPVESGLDDETDADLSDVGSSFHPKLKQAA